MNPWNSLVESYDCFDLSKVKQALQNGREITKPIQEQKEHKYNIKERDYVTYNYLDTKSFGNNSEYLKEVDSTNELPENGLNTLKSILWRTQERQEKRKYLDEFRDKERNRRKKEELEKEKKKIEEEKQKHEQLLTKLKEEYLLKKEKELIRRQNEARFLKNFKVAKSHHELKLMKNYFSQFKQILIIRNQQEILAEQHFKSKTIAVYFRKWGSYTKSIVEKKYNKADMFYNYKILRKSFSVIKEERENALIKAKNCEEFYSKKLLHKYIIIWKKISEEEKLTMRTKFCEAQKHYDRKLQQRTIKKLQLWTRRQHQRADEDKMKRNLRDVVKNLLPDFNPFSSSDEDPEDEPEEEECSSRIDKQIWKSKIHTYTC